MMKFIKIMLAVVILLFLLNNSQLQFSLLYHLLSKPLPLLLIFLMCYATVLLNSIRWYRLLKIQNIFMPLRKTVLLTYLGAAYNSILPGSVGGDFVRLYFILKSFPEKKSSATLSILVDRINGLFGILVIASLTAPYYIHTYRNHDSFYYILLSCIMILIGSLFTFLLLCLLLSEKSGLSQKIINTVSQKRYGNIIISILEALLTYRNAKLIIFENVVLSIFSQIFLLMIIIILSNTMNFPSLTPFDYMIALAIAQIVNLIPLTPGGIGIGEAAFANILILLNPGTNVAYATVFLAMRLLSTITYLPGAIFGIFGFDALRKQPLTSHASS